MANPRQHSKWQLSLCVLVFEVGRVWVLFYSWLTTHPQPSSKLGHETHVSDAQRRDSICLHLLRTVILAQEDLAVGLHCERACLYRGLRIQKERNERRHQYKANSISFGACRRGSLTKLPSHL